MNLITGVDMAAELATIYDLDDDGLPVVDLPVAGLTRQEAIDTIEKEAKRLAQEQDYRDDPYLASQGMNWRPQ